MLVMFTMGFDAQHEVDAIHAAVAAFNNTMRFDHPERQRLVINALQGEDHDTFHVHYTWLVACMAVVVACQNIQWATHTHLAMEFVDARVGADSILSTWLGTTIMLVLSLEIVGADDQHLVLSMCMDTAVGALLAFGLTYHMLFGRLHPCARRALAVCYGRARHRASRAHTNHTHTDAAGRGSDENVRDRDRGGDSDSERDSESDSDSGVHDHRHRESVDTAAGMHVVWFDYCLCFRVVLPHTDAQIKTFPLMHTVRLAVILLGTLPWWMVFVHFKHGIENGHFAWMAVLCIPFLMCTVSILKWVFVPGMWWRPTPGRALIIHVICIAMDAVTLLVATMTTVSDGMLQHHAARSARQRLQTA